MSTLAPTQQLDDRVVVIAGGLGAVGRATALRMAWLGARIVILHRREASEAAALIATLEGHGHLGVRASITESAQLREAALQVSRQCGAAHILVNTAGFTKPVPADDLEGLTDSLIDDSFASNFRGVFATIRAFHPLLKATGDGLVVNVSSIAGITGTGSNLA